MLMSGLWVNFEWSSVEKLLEFALYFDLLERDEYKPIPCVTRLPVLSVDETLPLAEWACV